MSTEALTTLVDQVLPAVALSLWCAIYLVYFGRDPDFRRWLERQIFQVSHRNPRPPSPAPSPMPVTFLPQPPRTLVRPSGAPAGLVRPSGSVAIASTRVAEWQAANLPMRYRLLGQVRAASNDN